MFLLLLLLSPSLPFSLLSSVMSTSSALRVFHRLLSQDFCFSQSECSPAPLVICWQKTLNTKVMGAYRISHLDSRPSYLRGLRGLHIKAAWIAWTQLEKSILRIIPSIRSHLKLATWVISSSPLMIYNTSKSWPSQLTWLPFLLRQPKLFAIIFSLAHVIYDADCQKYSFQIIPYQYGIKIITFLPSFKPPWSIISQTYLWLFWNKQTPCLGSTLE